MPTVQPSPQVPSHPTERSVSDIRHHFEPDHWVLGLPNEADEKCIILGFEPDPENIENDQMEVLVPSTGEHVFYDYEDVKGYMIDATYEQIMHSAFER